MCVVCIVCVSIGVFTCVCERISEYTVVCVCVCVCVCVHKWECRKEHKVIAFHMGQHHKVDEACRTSTHQIC